MLGCLTPVLSSATAINADALAFGDPTVGAWTDTGATTRTQLRCVRYRGEGHMRKAVLLAAAVFVVALVPGGTALAYPPDRVPTANQPVDLAAGDVCAFNVHVEPVVDKEVSTSHYDSAGNLRWIGVTGRLIVEATNTDTGKSVRVNISGPGRFSFLPDGTLMLDATGNWLLFQRAIDTPSHEMLLNSGHIIANLGSAPGAPVVIQQRTGHASNLCNALV